MIQTATPNIGSTFESDVQAIVPAVQDAFTSIIETYCGGSEGEVGITAICQRLAIHRKLAWQIRNVAYSPDPFRALRFMPTRKGIERLAGSISQSFDGVPQSTIMLLLESAEGLERLVSQHAAGDWTRLEMLASSRAGDQPGADIFAAEQWREKSFLGNSFIWGVQARTQLSVAILNQSASKPDWIDMVQVRGLVGLKRMRPDVYWLINQSVVRDDRNPGRTVNRVPLDAEAAQKMGGVPVLPDFCSQPVPRLRRRMTEGGLVHDELEPMPIGQIGQQTIITGEMIRELGGVYATAQSRRALFGAAVRTPCESFVYDHFVHRDLFPGVERELCVFSEINSPVSQDEHDRLPAAEKIEHLGTGLTSARSPDVPGYPELLRSLFASAGWDADEFELYRIQMNFPPMPSTVLIRHPLRVPPGEKYE